MSFLTSMIGGSAAGGSSGGLMGSMMGGSSSSSQLPQAQASPIVQSQLPQGLSQAASQAQAGIANQAQPDFTADLNSLSVDDIATLRQLISSIQGQS